MAEQRTSLNDFTEEERQIIDNLYGRNFEDATPEEIQLYGEWQAVNALLEQAANEQTELIREQTAQTLENHKAVTSAALDTLEALRELAQAKLKAVENGQA